MGYGTLLVSPEKIKLADDVFVWHHSILDGTGGLEIGSGTQIGSWVGIFTHSSHMSIRLEAGRYFESTDPEGFIIKPVKIGRNVFIASGSKIGPGVTIGDNVIIAMNTVITKDVPNYAIVGGIPAKVIGSTKDLDSKYWNDKKKNKK
jgi:acetyltransferase-like isoleucine patch superfamily enzyme